MASNFCSLSVKILTLFLTILLFLPRAVTAVPEQELESMIAVLRARGYNLFCNAIITSDVHYEVLAGTSFTFFAPIDSLLFALDMTATSSDYITTLRYHVVPGRFSLSDLRTLPIGNSSLHTLVPRHDIRIKRRPSPVIDNITADGVGVIVPGLFYGRDIAVHGLAGILSFRSQIGQLHESSPSPLPTEANFSGDHSFPSPMVGSSQEPPQPAANFSGNHSSVVGNRHSPPPANSASFDRNEPPSNVDGFSPANSPAMSGFQLGISPAYGLWTGISTSPALSPKIHPPVPSIPEDDNPGAPSPSSGDRFADHGGDSGPMLADLILSERYEAPLVDVRNDMEESMAESSSPGELPVMTPRLRKKVFAGITTVSPELPWPYDSDTLDCPVRDQSLLSHVSFQPGDPHTTVRHYTISDPTCART